MERKTRGFVIERAQPFTTYDLELAQRILDEHDELVVGIGNAGYSHEPGELMTAGERIELTDRILQAADIPPHRYSIIPIENAPEASQWVAEAMTVTPKWDAFYTRNFKNASMFRAFQRQHGYAIRTVSEQKPQRDYFELLAQSYAGMGHAMDELRVHVTDAAIEGMDLLGITDRARIIYNREEREDRRRDSIDRALFLGRLQPVTGIYDEGTGHLGVLRNALDRCNQIVIAIGSAQKSHELKNALTAGQRIDVTRHALLENGVDPSRFSLVPVKDIASNAGFAKKVGSLCPAFSSVVAGNDWTKELFGKGQYDIIPVERNVIPGTTREISATMVRSTVIDTLKTECTKEGPIAPATIALIEQRLGSAMDRATLDKLREVGFYETMKFLTFAVE